MICKEVRPRSSRSQILMETRFEVFAQRVGGFEPENQGESENIRCTVQILRKVCRSNCAGGVNVNSGRLPYQITSKSFAIYSTPVLPSDSRSQTCGC